MKKEIESILTKLETMHGKPRAELNYSNPLELTVAVVLSAQCTDERVNRVTEHLFKQYPSLQDISTRPWNGSKRRNGRRASTGTRRGASRRSPKELKERFGGRVPDDIDTFATVKGIGRKSANMIVGLAYGKPAIIVDTHMIRVTNRIGFTREQRAE